LNLGSKFAKKSHDSWKEFEKFHQYAELDKSETFDELGKCSKNGIGTTFNQ
jgi:hypothetical protein